VSYIKPFEDEGNHFRWFIEHDCTPEQEKVRSWYRYEADFERGLEVYAPGLISFGVYVL